MIAANLMPDPTIPAEHKLAFLVSLNGKGETVEEVTAFAKVFRQLAIDPKLSDYADKAIDIVGTGGTGSKGFNISSVTAFIVAASGTPVLKHGNRAITSQSGSADFLSQQGIRMDTDPSLLRQAIEELNFCFFFAPAFHPAFKEIMPIRKQLAETGKRTIFNILGPLINPARPAHQLLGVPSPEWVQPLAGALDQLGLKNGLTVCSALSNGACMDELTTAGINHVCGMGHMRTLADQWAPDRFGLSPTTPQTIQGGTAEQNVALLDQVMAGNGPNGLLETLALNAAAAFKIVQKVDTIEDGCALAKDILLGGALKTWLNQAKAFYRKTDEKP